MEGYMTALEAGNKWGVSESAVKKAIAAGRVAGMRAGKKPNVVWLVPVDAEPPIDRRRTKNFLPVNSKKSRGG